jgi:RNA polymerase sigma factor (sigma-70 family)
VGKKGASQAQIEALYSARFGHFVKVATAICHDPELGRDVVQSAFTAALRNRKSFRGESALEGWIWRIVVNEARSAAREPNWTAAQGGEPQTNGNGAHDGDPLNIRAWIATLPERQREAVFLRYFADLDYSTIADTLGIEVGTVSATLGAAHRSLRKRLQEVRQ